MADDCLFCRIVRKELPVTLVAEDEHSIAFRDINPQAPVHVLVIPRAHVASLDTATDAAMIGRLSLMAARDRPRRRRQREGLSNGDEHELGCRSDRVSRAPASARWTVAALAARVTRI